MKAAAPLILHVSSRSVKICVCVCIVGFHVRFGPDVKEKLRSALFPKLLLFKMCLFLYVRSGDCLIDPALLSLSPTLTFSRFSFSFCQLIFVSDFYSTLPPSSSCWFQSLRCDHKAELVSCFKALLYIQY